MKNRILTGFKAVAAVAITATVFSNCSKVDESTTDDSVTAERRWRGGHGGWWGNGGNNSGGGSDTSSGGNTDTTTTPTNPGTNPGGPTGGTSFNFSALSSDFSRPQSGAEVWYNGFQVSIPGVSASDRYIRFNWAGLNPGQGQYNWTIFDQEINKAIDGKQGFSFGIMTQYLGGQGSAGIANYDGAYSAYPQWVHNQMQSESVKDFKDNGDWVPNWNSNSYLSAFENFLNALNSHIQTTSYRGTLYKNVINAIDIRGYGNFGEFHCWPYGDGPSSATRATTATLKRIIDAHKNAFNDFQLQAMISGMGDSWSAASAEISYYLLTQSTRAGQFGIRRDNWGATESWYNESIWENNPRTYNGVALKNLIMDKFKTAPITGEPCCNSGYASLPSQVTKYHVSSFGNGNYGSVTGSNVVTASKLAGARLALTTGSLAAGTGSLSVTLNWTNTGVSPVYKNWDVVYEVKNGSTVVKSIKSAFNPRLFLPGTKSVSDNISGIPAGTYSLTVKVTDPNGYRQPYPLAVGGRNSDGSYTLMNGVVIK